DTWSRPAAQSHRRLCTGTKRGAALLRSICRFRCGSCYKYWPSARVVVLFRYRLRSDRGTVLMRPFGQVQQALLRLFHKIRKNCYGEREEDGDFGSDCREKACTQGICCQED
uniref:3CxxC-type domain-containing protein n=1 Tax=Scleropages formosus TaxID=113540 RepID=A0A8C9U170_SCLFO